MNLYKVLPVCSLFFIACSDENSDSIFNAESENLTSSSWIASSSSNSRNDVSSSSQNVAQSSSECSSSSRHSRPDPESSSSSWIASSSSNSSNDVSCSSSIRNDVNSSSSIVALSSSVILAASSSSATVAVSSSSETLADPTKLFDTRVPNQEALFCMDSTAYTVFKRYVEEKDLICSFEYDGDEGFVYVQSNPTKCIGSELTPVYDVHKAEFFVNGSKQEITDVKYYGGGSHGTYSIRFTYKGKVFDYGYSTMGMGGRPCQDVDCMNVYEADGKTLVQNGCVNRERSLPVVCRHAKKDGTFTSFEDTYHICEYDIFGD
ncbi:hypothetical protein [Fibrobacter succinogenes]|uniref:hypothetical protein n=1 Tax=Fibrobacter succinogenes TaxID=833 RepID=UPI00156932E9|nr:hypothetical protein [Fibrobacter succinogenes]